MKRFLSITLGLIFLLLVSCNISTPVVENTLGFTIDEDAKGGKSDSGMLNNSDIKTIIIKFFYSDDGSLIPIYLADGTQNGTLLPNGETFLTRTTSSEAFSGGQILIPTGLTGEVYFHAMCISDSTGEIKYQGTTESKDISAFGTMVDIATVVGYPIGARGPDGGWIISDQGMFGNWKSTNGFSAMDKSWRYIELAAKDLVKEWDDSSQIDTENYKFLDGKVVEKSNSKLVIDSNSFYWGTSGTYGTKEGSKDGYVNTHLFDTMSSATPGIGKKVKGRKNSGNSGNHRRDTSSIVEVDVANNKNCFTYKKKKNINHTTKTIILK